MAALCALCSEPTLDLGLRQAVMAHNAAAA